ncbi:MAG: penicillin-binding protein 2 [Candidatus Neomarinimicrobiota bacterium]|nr:penicillin-binding protein 2 [Candidatus Neomarinimicrobiota bacterium]
MLKSKNLVPRSRLLTAYLFITFVFLILLIRFGQIQLFEYKQYKKRADINSIRAVPVSAPRGLILDRKGHILVDNFPTYILTALPNEINNNNFSIISSCTGKDTLSLKRNFKRYYRGRFIPSRITKDLSFDELSCIEEHKHELMGVNYSQLAERSFPSKVGMSHVLGYVKEIDRSLLTNINTDIQYDVGDLIGWQGIEKQYEYLLKGTKGVSYSQVDAFGREVGSVKGIANIKAFPGKDLFTTIDLGLQKTMEKSMSKYKGVILITDPLTGEILSFVSSPDFSPEIFTGNTSLHEWRNLVNDPRKPLLNRITNGLYPPGSTFKMITAIALLEGLMIEDDEVIECSGIYQYGDRLFKCWKVSGHGKVNLDQAIAQSCNIFFYQSVQRISMNRFIKLCRNFGFGIKTGIDLPTELAGLLPTRDYMNKRYTSRGWSRGHLLNMALGQGDLLVTPIQLSVYINKIATNGKTFVPHFNLNKNPEPVNQINLKDQTWVNIQNYLFNTVNSVKGTGRAANPQMSGLKVYGKTGTAQNPHGDDHAWFVGYAEKGKKMVSIVLLIENGGSGGKVAAPLAGSAFKYIFNNNLNRIALNSVKSSI